MRLPSVLFLLPLLLGTTVCARYLSVPLPYRQVQVGAQRVPIHSDLYDDDDEEQEVVIICTDPEEIHYMFPVLTRDPHATAESGIRLRVCGGHNCKKGNDCPQTFNQMLFALVFNEGISPTLSVDEAYKALHLYDPVANPYPSDEERKLAESKPAIALLAPAAATMDEALKSLVPAQAVGLKQNGIVAACKKWHLAKDGDSCYWIAQGNGIPLNDFYHWNPAVSEKSECEGLWVGYMYCVGV